MKFRETFVSNSSSCSFIVPKEGMSEEQIENANAVLNLITGLTYYEGSYDEHESCFEVYIDQSLNMGVVDKIASLLGVNLKEGYYDGEKVVLH